VKLSAPLILVVSALLLCAQRNPQPESKYAIEKKQTSSQHLTPTEQPSLIKKQVAQATPDQNYTYTPTPTPSGNPGEPTDSAWWFNFWLCAFTGILAFVSVVQCFILRYANQTSRLALKADRPYLILEHAQLTGVSRGDDPVIKEPQQNELTTPPRFFPRVVLNFRNYGKGPVIFREGLIRIDAFAILPPARDFSGCQRMGLQANAVRAGGIWYPLAQFNYEADWTALFPDIAAERKCLIAYGCVRYTDPIGEDSYETGFCWIFIPPRIEPQTMPPRIAELLAPDRAPGAPDPEMPISITMPGDFRLGPATHNYCD
jgi:hypothetical protein